MIKIFFGLKDANGICSNYMNLEINNKEVFIFKDKLRLRLIPRDVDYAKKIILSRNKINPDAFDFFKLTNKEKEEYDSCKTDKEIALKCIEDIKKVGGLILRREEI